MLVGRGADGVLLLSRLWWHGYAPPLEPLGVLSACVLACVGLAGTVLLVRDAGWDRPAPVWLPGVLAVLSIAPLRAPAGGAADPDAALLRCAATLVAGERGRCGASGYRDRLLRSVPIRVHEIHEAAGPVRVAPPGTAPGTLLVARGTGGRFGWITAVGLGPAGARLVRSGSEVWVAGFTERSAGGVP